MSKALKLPFNTTVKLPLSTMELKHVFDKVEKRVKELIPPSTLKRVEGVRKEVTRQLSKLEKVAQGRLKQTMKLLRIPSREELNSARRARVNSAAKTFGIVTHDEFQKLQKKVNKLDKQITGLNAGSTRVAS